jgi:hypothetical protein
MDFDPSDDNFFGPPPSGKGPRPNLVFERRAIPNEGKSAEAGRSIFDEIDYVTVRNPGSRDTFISKAADYAKTDEFAAWAYKKWKVTQEQVTDGTPIETVPFLNKAQVQELKALGVHSLETLADLPDTAKQRFMGSIELSKKAKAYLASAKDTALATKLQAEVSKKDKELEFMRKQIAETNARFEALSAKLGA